MVTIRNSQGVTTTSSNTLYLPAGDNIGGHRVVMVEGGEAVYFDISTSASIGKELGISNNATSTGGSVEILTNGIITNPGWGLTPDTIYYAGASGIIQSTAPNPGVVLQVGVAVTVDSLKIGLSQGFMTI